MKKFLCGCLVCGLVLSGCSASNSSSSTRQGTYKGEAQGFGGMVIAYVTYTEGVISDIVLEGEQETIGKGSVAMEKMAPAIVSANSEEVDGVSGATLTSNAVKEAVRAAIDSKETVEYTKKEVEVAFTAGTYTASAFGHNFPLTVEVVLSDTALESVTVTDDKSDTAMHNATAEAIPERIIEKQSLNVDIISGATETSNAIINAVADCVEQGSSKEVAQALLIKAKDTTEAKEEEYTADVLVIGGGGSGLTTAYSLSEQGYSVVIMEAADILGGMTNVCGGGSLSIGSTLQKEADVYANDEEALTLQHNETSVLLKAADYQANAGFIVRYVDILDEYVDWAMDAGIEYSASSATTARLMNKGSRFDAVISQLSENGATILTQTRGTALIQDENGVITGGTGVNATGGTTTVHAKAVVLATGGFLANETMVNTYIPEATEYFENWSGSSRYQGDGISMAWQAGAAVGEFGVQPHDSMIPESLHALGISTHSPTSFSNAAYYPGLWVNDQGVRFINENIGNGNAEAHGAVTMYQGHYYSVLDSKLIDLLENEGSPIGGWMSMKGATPGLKDQIEKVIASGSTAVLKADTLDELAALMGCDAETLKETVASYNSYVETGVDTQFDKPSMYLIDSIEEGPYYAFENVSRVLAAYGGLKMDENMCVLSTSGAPVTGLYAVGLDAGSFMGNVYSVTTTTAGFSIASGYMAGESVGEFLKD